MTTATDVVYSTRVHTAVNHSADRTEHCAAHTISKYAYICHTPQADGTQAAQQASPSLPSTAQPCMVSAAARAVQSTDSFLSSRC